MHIIPLAISGSQYVLPNQLTLHVIRISTADMVISSLYELYPQLIFIIRPLSSLVAWGNNNNNYSTLQIGSPEAEDLSMYNIMSLTFLTVISRI